MQMCLPMGRISSFNTREALSALLLEVSLSPSCHPTWAPQAWNSLDLEVAQQQAAPLHHQHAVLHRLIQWVGEEHLHVHRLPYMGLVQQLWGERRVQSGLGCSSYLPLSES